MNAPEVSSPRSAFDFRRSYPAPYVPRRLTFEVRERIDSEGLVTLALDEAHLLALLDQQRTRAHYAQGYGPANVLALLHEHWGHVRGLDLSQLVLRGAYLQGVEMQDATLAGALIRESVFTETFDATWAVAISSSGQYWAAGSRHEPRPEPSEQRYIACMTREPGERALVCRRADQRRDSDERASTGSLAGERKTEKRK